MVFNYKLVVVCFVAILFNACTGDQKNDQDATYIKDSIDLPDSELGFTLFYNVKRIQQALNDNTTETIFHDWIALNERDSLLLDASRFDEVKLDWENEELAIKLPLVLKGNYKKDILGVLDIQNKKPIEAKVMINFATKLDLYSNWHLKTKSEIRSIEWLEDPHLKIAFIDVNLRKKIERKLRKQEGMLVQKLDSLIAMEISVEKPVSDMWKQVQQPMRISRKKIPLFLRAKITNMEAKIRENSIDTIFIQLGLKTKLFIESDSIFQKEIAPLPDFKSVKKVKDTLVAYALFSAGFNLISDSLNVLLKNDTTISKEYGVQLSNVKITGKRNKLHITASVNGQVDGDVVVTCQPQMDNDEKIIFFSDFDYQLSSENDFINIGANNLEEYITELLKSYLTFDISEWLEGIPQAIEEGVEDGKTGQKIAVSINELKINVKYISIKEKQLNFMAQGNGSGSLEVEHVEPKFLP